MKFWTQPEMKKKLIILSLIYLAAQGMLLIISGKWWDDWTLYNQSDESLKSMALQLGRPTVYLSVNFAKMLPECGYRILTFFMFYFCMLFVYKILKLWLNASDEACFWISALYAVIPANDARVVLAVFPYTVGLFLFMAGMSILAGGLYNKELRWKKRIVILILFFCSYILNSNLCFYGIVLLMILMMEKNKKRWVSYIDFLLLPIVFFVLKSKLFPVYGSYANYNTISSEKIVGAFRYVTPIACHIVKSLFVTLWENGKTVFVYALLVTIVYLVIFRWGDQIPGGHYWKDKMLKSNLEKDSIKSDDPLKENLLLLLIGFIGLIAAWFSYVAVRGFRGVGEIVTVNLQGRDAVLVAFGSAMIMYSMISLVIDKRIRNFVLVFLVVSGILFFNKQYLSYQQDYYRQLGFRYQLKQNDELKDAKNILYCNSDPGLINIKTFYQLNGNAEEVYGVQDKFIATQNEIQNLQQDETMQKLVSNEMYLMKDYDLDHKKIDAVIQYSMNIDLSDTFKMKLCELVSSDKFDLWIADRSSMKTYYSGMYEFDKLMREYELIGLSWKK